MGGAFSRYSVIVYRGGGHTQPQLQGGGGHSTSSIGEGVSHSTLIIGLSGPPHSLNQPHLFRGGGRGTQPLLCKFQLVVEAESYNAIAESVFTNW